MTIQKAIRILKDNGYLLRHSRNDLAAFKTFYILTNVETGHSEEIDAKQLEKQIKAMKK